MSTDVSDIRQREVEVFHAFTGRALQIINASDSANGTLSDACRLVDTALKATRGDEPAEANDEGKPHPMQPLVEMVCRAYGKKVISNQSSVISDQGSVTDH